MGSSVGFYQLLIGNCDVFAPCALGGVLNEWSIPTLNTSVIAGAANNQLLTQENDMRWPMREFCIVLINWLTQVVSLTSIIEDMATHKKISTLG